MVFHAVNIFDFRIRFDFTVKAFSFSCPHSYSTIQRAYCEIEVSSSIRVKEMNTIFMDMYTCNILYINISCNINSLVYHKHRLIRYF